MCNPIEPGLLGAVDTKVWRMGYRPSGGDTRAGRNGKELRAFLVGALGGGLAIWPRGLTAGPGEGDKFQNMLGWQKVDEPLVATLEEIIKLMGRSAEGR